VRANRSLMDADGITLPSRLATHYRTPPVTYYGVTGKKKPPTHPPPARLALASNAAFLVDEALKGGRTINGSATRSRLAKDVSPKTLHNLRNDLGIDPRLSTIVAVADQFGLHAWQLLVPDLTAELLLNPKFMKVVLDYVHTPPDDRIAIETVAAATARAAG